MLANSTGLSGQAPSRRYLWNDAFAVCNFLSLHQETRSERYWKFALELVDQVHHVLGRHRADDPRRGWISRLPEEEGESHPTRGGLRIGKKPGDLTSSATRLPRHCTKRRFVDDGKLPQYTRCEFHFAGDGCLAYLSRRLLGHIFIVKNRDQLVQQKQLGPDALDVGAEQFCSLFADRKGSLKTALMDQSLIAGIGNVYSDEMLFHLGLHPKVKVQSLDRKSLNQLYDVCQRVLKTAIRHHADPRQMPPDYLLPHREEHGHCPCCGTRLKKLKVGSRNAVICPKCQIS